MEHDNNLAVLGCNLNFSDKSTSNWHVGDFPPSDNTLTLPAIQTYYREYWAPHVGFLITEDKTTKAFNVIETLMSGGYLKIDKVKDFVSIVKLISEKL